MRLKRMLLFPGALLLAAASGFASPVKGVAGDWMSPDKAIVRVYPCGSQVCLKIVKLSPTIPEKKDAKNPKSDLRDRPLCGLNIGTGFRQVDAQHLADGQIYDPESGRTYSGTVAADGDEMKLRGFVLGISLLGRTETWHRATGVQGECR
jgi:uncharacterized protein (DUF2147 family)